MTEQDKIWEEFDGLSTFDLDEGDYLYKLLDVIDFEPQLQAIMVALHRNKAAGAKYSEGIKESEQWLRKNSGPHHDHYVDQHVDLLHMGVFYDAATSMAAIGMVAPMLESIFSEVFFSLGDRYGQHPSLRPDHHRWARADAAGSNNHWDCQKHFNNENKEKSDIISGIMQLSKACGLSKFISSENQNFIRAMFYYRNYMFHNGFEWPLDKREEFNVLLSDHKLDKYFSNSITDGKPWIFYIDDNTIENIPNTMKEITGSLAKFAMSLPRDLFSDM